MKNLESDTEFSEMEGNTNTFLSVFRSQFVAIGPAKNLKIGQRIMFLWPKYRLKRDFALAREIIHAHKFSFYTYFLT